MLSENGEVWKNNTGVVCMRFHDDSVLLYFIPEVTIKVWTPGESVGLFIAQFICCVEMISEHELELWGEITVVTTTSARCKD